MTLRASISGEVGKDDPIGIEVAVDLKVRSRFFDAVDFVAHRPWRNLTSASATTR